MLSKDTTLCISLSGRPSNIGTRFHNYLYNKLDIDFIYKAFSTNNIEHAIHGVRGLGIRGCSVSMPFKESCIPFLDEITDSAKAIDSVNTIVNDNGKLIAYNTDFLAIHRLIEENALDSAAQVVVQGSGGMAKAVVAAFHAHGFKHLTVIARNSDTGNALAEKYGYRYVANTENLQADIIVNVTPIGMTGGAEADSLAFPESMIEAAQVVFDVVAFPSQTPLIKRAQSLGKKVISGDQVIALQALEQFELYTGVRPSDELMREASEYSRA